MKFNYVVLMVLALGIALIHINSFAFPHSVIVRHVILIVFMAVAGYLAYESRRRHLEAYEKLREFLRICSWCKKVCFTDPQTGEERWLPFEEYMALEHNSTSSHGICPDCYRRLDIYSDTN